MPEVVLQVVDLTLNAVTRRVTRAGNSIALQPREFLLAGIPDDATATSW